MTTQQTAPRFSFTFYRFVGPEGNRTTEVVRDFTLADGMRALLEGSSKTLDLARERVSEWSTSKGITVNVQEPFPSEKYHEVQFDASTLASGMYLYKLTAGSFTQVRKLVLVR